MKKDIKTEIPEKCKQMIKETSKIDKEKKKTSYRRLLSLDIEKDDKVLMETIAEL